MIVPPPLGLFAAPDREICDMREEYIIDVGIRVSHVTRGEPARVKKLRAARVAKAHRTGGGGPVNRQQRVVVVGAGRPPVEILVENRLAVRSRDDVDPVPAVKRMSVVGDRGLGDVRGVGGEEADHVRDQAMLTGPEDALRVIVVRADDELFEGPVEERVAGGADGKDLRRIGVKLGARMLLAREQ